MCNQQDRQMKMGRVTFWDIFHTVFSEIPAPPIAELQLPKTVPQTSPTLGCQGFMNAVMTVAVRLEGREALREILWAGDGMEIWGVLGDHGN